MTTLDNDIQEAKNKLELLIRQKVAYAELPDNQKVALKLHSCMCRMNHIDGCSWEYEIKNVDGIRVHDWQGWTHDHYMGRAISFVAACQKIDVEIDKALSILDFAYKRA